MARTSESSWCCYRSVQRVSTKRRVGSLNQEEDRGQGHGRGRGGGQPAPKSDDGQNKNEERKRKFSDRSRCYGCEKNGHGLFSCRDTPEAKRQKLIAEHKLRGPGKIPNANPRGQYQTNNASQINISQEKGLRRKGQGINLLQDELWQ